MKKVTRPMTMIFPTPPPDSAPTLVELTEWAQVGPEQFPVLAEQSLVENVLSQPLAEALRNRLDIRRSYHGLEITSTSFVGRVDVGRLRISILPKLPAMPLARLLRYAYSLRDLATIEETRAPTTRHGLHDLLIVMLANEVEELLHRGPARRYVPLTNNTDSPRGRILINQVVRNGGVREARLPCRYFHRHINWQLNQTLRAGLEAAAQMTDDRDLRRRAHKLAAGFGDVDQKTRLLGNDIDRAERGLTRLTAANAPALSIIRLLHGMLGLGFEREGALSRIPGFLFDMNRFFQRLLSRFLHENLVTARIEDEWAVRNVFAYAPHANPRRRTAPAPRPDFALFSGNALRGFLDAKYRDIWDRDFPAEWLYQLSMYALASPVRVSVMLYASMSAEARDEQVDVRSPMHGMSGGSAAVIIRPVPLQSLAVLVNADQTVSLADKRQRMAAELVTLRTGRPAENDQAGEVRAA
jgi:5-methylcytosine-specific restriction enzyme subunit McrC